MISIVIPYYNHNSAIEGTLRSIAAQERVVTEVIIIDDGSTEPLDIEFLQSIIPNVRLIRQKNLGAPAARNRGLREAKGTYIIFWDADVVAEPKMLVQMKQVLDSKPEIDFVYSNFVFGPKQFTACAFSPAAFRERNRIHTTTLLRRAVAPQWDESLTKLQDWDYWLTMIDGGSAGYWIDETLFRVGQRKEGMSRWIPSFAYKAPFRYLPYVSHLVQAYEEAEQIVRKKHGI